MLLIFLIKFHVILEDKILSDTIYDVYFFFFSESIFRIIFDTQMCVYIYYIELNLILIFWTKHNTN